MPWHEPVPLQLFPTAALRFLPLQLRRPDSRRAPSLLGRWVRGESASGVRLPGGVPSEGGKTGDSAPDPTRSRIRPWGPSLGLGRPAAAAAAGGPGTGREKAGVRGGEEVPRRDGGPGSRRARVAGRLLPRRCGSRPPRWPSLLAQGHRPPPRRPGRQTPLLPLPHPGAAALTGPASRWPVASDQWPDPRFCAPFPRVPRTPGSEVSSPRFSSPQPSWRAREIVLAVISRLLRRPAP